MLTLLLGGARSGKSALAVRLGRQHRGAVTYLATSPRIDGDTDLDRRIESHRGERPPGWQTKEEELELADAFVAIADSLVILDCLTLWVNNMIHHGRTDEQIYLASEAALTSIGRRADGCIAISNEVGLGIVPQGELSRRYRDVLGRVNQQWASASDNTYLLVAGRALSLHDVDDLELAAHD